MLSFSGSLKIFVLVEPCDMRKGFNGLYGMVSTTFGEDPRSGALFVFSNRRHTRINVCVTSLEMIDKAHAIARRADVIFTSFGDMLRVPGSE